MPTVVFVGGPAGTGKSTIGQLLAQHWACPMVEGDELHPKANVDKMARGEPLTDDDRWDWLSAVSRAVAARADAPENKLHVAVGTCLMLKKVYREHMRSAIGDYKFVFVFLYTTYDELMARVQSRQGHYMKLDMVRLQYDIMEVPAGAEHVSNGGDCFSVDTSGRTPAMLVQHIVEHVAAD